MAIKLCPFCGCQAWMYSASVFEGGIWGHRIECEGDCHAMTCWWHTKEEAENHWNQRVKE